MWSDKPCFGNCCVCCLNELMFIIWRCSSAHIILFLRHCPPPPPPPQLPGIVEFCGFLRRGEPSAATPSLGEPQELMAAATTEPVDSMVAEPRSHLGQAMMVDAVAPPPPPPAPAAAPDHMAVAGMAHQVHQVHHPVIQGTWRFVDALTQHSQVAASRPSPSRAVWCRLLRFCAV